MEMWMKEKWDMPTEQLQAIHWTPVKRAMQGTGKAKAAHVKICHDLWPTNAAICKRMGLEDTEDKTCNRCGIDKETVEHVL